MYYLYISITQVICTVEFILFDRMAENYSKANTEYVFETDNKLAITFNMDNVTKNPLKVRSMCNMARREQQI